MTNFYLSAIIFLQFFPNCHSKLNQMSTDEELQRKSLADCVLKAAGRFFEEGEVITYSLPLSEVNKSETSLTALDRFVLSSLTYDGLWSVIVKNVTLDQHELTGESPKPQHYVIQIRHEKEFEYHIDILKTYDNWNPHAKFLVISASRFENSRRVASEIVRKLWEVHAVNGVVLLPDRHNRTRFHAFTWYPYEEDNCGDDFNKVVPIDSCSFGETASSVHWYPDKIPRRFNQCSVKVRVITWPPFVMNVPNGTWSSNDNLNRGIEVNILNLIAEIFNVKMFYYYSKTPLNWGDVYPNGTITGNLKYLYDETDDIAIGAYAKTMQRSLAFLDTLYHYDSLHWCVPHSPTHSKLDSLSKIMDSGAFVVTLCVYFVLTAMMWISSGDGEEKSVYKNFTTCMMKTFSILLGLSACSLPRSDGVRFFVAMLMMYSFYLVTAYQTLLASALANVSYQEQIRTVEDILRKNLKIYTLKTDIRYFTTDGSIEDVNEINAAILEKWQHCETLHQCLDHVALDRDSAVCLPKLYTEYVLDSYRNKNNDPLIYCFDKSIVSYPLNILMRKGFPIYEKVNLLVTRIVSSGLLLKWERDILRTRFENNTNFGVTVSSYDNDFLDFDSLKPAFIMLTVGCEVAGLVFFLEFFYNKWHNREFVSCKRKRN